MAQTLQAADRRCGPDQEASRLYSDYHDKILRYCVGQLRSREEAEDAVQNTFMRVVAALRKGVVPEFEGPWLYKIAHNVCLSRRLSWSRRARVETPADLDALGEKAAAYSADADELFGLDDALADMPPNLRRPLLMREWQGMSYMEIADALGVSHSAVETLIFRARRHLANALTDSVKRTGRALASIFNLKWLLEALKGLGGGGAGSTGLATGAACLAVAVGGGVAFDVVTQHSAASRARAPSALAGRAAAPTAALGRPGGASTRGTIPQRPASQRPAARVSAVRGSGAAATRARSIGTHAGQLPAAGGAAASAVGGTAPSNGVGPAAATPSSPSAATASSASTRSASSGAVHRPVRRSPTPSQPSSPGSPAPSLPSSPPISNPGSLVPPVSTPPLPSVPAVPSPPAVNPPPVPPVPSAATVPPVPSAPPVPPIASPPPVPPVPAVAAPPLPPVTSVGGAVQGALP